MDENKNVSAEELAAEQAALQEGKQEEIRAKVIEEFGFDETNDAERIEKLVNMKVEDSKKLSAAIGQKIKWRTEATKPKETVIPPKVETKVVPPEDIAKQVDEKLRQRDLEDMNISDEIRNDIDEWARFKNISVKQAAREPHLANKIADYEKEQKTEAASISRTNRSSGKKTYSMDNPPEVNMSTPEGRKEWQDYVDAMKKAGH